MFIIPALFIISALQSKPTLSVQVDPGMEVIAIAMWLAGKLPAPTDSTYKLAVWNQFKRFKHHPAIEALRSSKEMYTNLTERGMQISGWPSPRFAEPAHDVWRGFMGDASYDGFFKGFPDFALKSGFWKFYQGHRKEYLEWSTQFANLVREKMIVERMEAFYRYAATRPRPSFSVYLEPLNSWGAHALTGDDAGVHDSVVRYQLGFWGSESAYLDAPVRFTSANSLGDVAWHEGSHVYVEPLFNRYAAEINQTERLFNREMLEKQNIKTWRYCLNENVVRAVTAVLILQARGQKAYDRELSDQVSQRGFIYTKVIADLIVAEYLENKSFASFDDFFPKILTKLETLPPMEETESWPKKHVSGRQTDRSDRGSLRTWTW